MDERAVDSAEQGKPESRTHNGTIPGKRKEEKRKKKEKKKKKMEKGGVYVTRYM